MLLDELSDEKLMAMYQNGSEDAFQQLYSRHSSKIYGFLKKRIQKSEKLADIFQEVFIKIHKSKHLYNKTLPVMPWIFTITKSVMIDELRKDKKSNLTEDVDLNQIASFQAEASSFGEVATMMQRLPKMQKNALHMRYVDEKTFEEIADRLKTSPANVRQIISRGIKKLKEFMNQGSNS